MLDLEELRYDTPLSCLLRVLAGLAVPKVLADGNDKDDPTTWTPIKIEGDQVTPEFERAHLGRVSNLRMELRGELLVVCGRSQTTSSNLPWRRLGKSWPRIVHC
jgi:hypothetical protein